MYQHGSGSANGNGHQPHAAEITVEPAVDGVVVCALVGEHDLCTADKLEQEMADLIGGENQIVVDLSQATFIDLSCLGVLLRAQNELLLRSRPLVVQTGRETAARRLLELTGKQRFLNAVDERADALWLQGVGEEVHQSSSR